MWPISNKQYEQSNEAKDWGVICFGGRKTFHEGCVDIGWKNALIWMGVENG